ncbi:hypothetical protein CVT26_000585 [Gymnopilus dilepis]|uniref:Uncharacterized protein n=1 Tax=Gymnopilus dilepis TaxID=231916 RepID=A0A409VHA0_9AGAR|nr:hypothetical protein CVT26_000585 [Gymnopilus dilepis]
MADQPGKNDTYEYSSTSSFNSFFHLPGDGFRYSVTLPDKLEAAKSISADERAAYIMANFDIKEPDRNTFTKVSVVARDGHKYSITSPNKLEEHHAMDDSERKTAYVKENFDDKDGQTREA